MTTPGEPPAHDDRARIRASDTERDEIVEMLSAHATTGRLTLVELEERIERAYAATTRDELAALTSDLPAQTTEEPSTKPVRQKVTKWMVAVMGGTEKRGRWRASKRVNAVAVMGGHHVDLRDVELESQETTIVAVSIMGGVDIYVPDSVDVEVGGFSIMGGTSERGSRRAPRSGAPRIRILAYNLMGGANIWRLPEEARDVPLKAATKLAKKSE
ncbi:DUF1707 and DUF2154 domain-containing protein [Actinobacteria bacterium YIM 96077]|uniref:Uncharacterized protein n=1 Tax=Phytoactinopolyspora halophila TaxID=1981511 RepID=A0A329R4S7_9ACTN|nr:DUF1707 domain-containing protein [Phytoactinopolyspora halophila]AYY11391.1 DUF1707 and DUF2154 domain-containing protein [Actinobacteria bacterium YIM 96077]RAW18128.1 hypothetical protein DPM12_04705 [Phytoactinopolyspora halophila]